MTGRTVGIRRKFNIGILRMKRNYISLFKDLGVSQMPNNDRPNRRNPTEI